MSERRKSKKHLSTHKQIAYDVARAHGILPDDLRAILVKYRRALKKGAVYPDVVLKDFAYHYVGPERRGAIGNILRLITKMQVERQDRSPKETALQFGILAHYVADLGNPLHCNSTPEEKKIHSEMETDVKKHLWIMPFKYYEIELKDISDIQRYLEIYISRALSSYQAILDAYMQGNGLPACLEAVQEAYSESCNMVANIWLYVWGKK